MTKTDKKATNPEVKAGLALLREPFKEHQISKLPKPTRAQTDEVKRDFKAGVRCKVCGGWHHPKVVHLDYVGHAALTDRLLDADPNWNWEPASDGGVPVMDENGGMWIKLTVCGITRYGYGHPDGKKGGDAIKEAIGDALRNAAMRFGAALDLWHKGDLHPDPDGDDPQEGKPDQITPDQYINLKNAAEAAGVDDKTICEACNVGALQEVPASSYDAVMKKLQKTIDNKKPVDDEIPH